MKLLPYNIIYNGVDLRKIDPKIELIEDLYLKYTQISDLINDEKVVLITYPVSVDDDNFTLKNAFGKEVKSIIAYSIDKQNFTYSEISFPASKKTYSDIFNSDTLLIKVNKEIPYLFPIFNKSINYKALDRRYINRLEYVVNIFFGAAVSTIDGSIDNIEGSQVKIKNSNEEVALTVHPDYITVKENDNVSTGDLLEKLADIIIDNGIVINIKYSKADIQKIALLAQLDVKINLTSQS